MPQSEPEDYKTNDPYNNIGENDIAPEDSAEQLTSKAMKNYAYNTENEDTYTTDLKWLELDTGVSHSPFPGCPGLSLDNEQRFVCLFITQHKTFCISFTLFANYF